MSAQTKSFVILFTIALVGIYICLALFWIITDNNPESAFYNMVLQGKTSSRLNSINPETITEPDVDTSTWKTYMGKDSNFSFKYSPSWNILSATQKDDWVVLQIDPGKKYYNFYLYISPKDYYALNGLPAQKEEINGQMALNIGNNLYGFFANSLYYTFDIGSSIKLEPEFVAMVHTVKFQ